MMRILPPFVLLLLTGLILVSGVIQGRMSERWGPSKDSLEAAEALDDLPTEAGPWQMTKSDQLSEGITKMLECTGWVLRTYQNMETGETVSVTVLVGPPGPMAVHTPEICYSSKAYAIRDEREAVSVGPSADDSDNELWSVTFRTNDVDADMLRVYYGWSTGTKWVAADDPRLTYATLPYLYKMQLAGVLTPGADPEMADPCRRFLQDFIPAAQEHLRPADE